MTKKQLPKTCLTCKFMDFTDDELEELRCFEPWTMLDYSKGKIVKDTDRCILYKLNLKVKEDMKMGCW